MKSSPVASRLLQLVALVTCAATLATAGCGESGAARDDGKLVVAVSVPPHAWLVEQLVDDEAEVIALVQPGDSPHTYQPTDQQMIRLSRADVYFRTGVAFEQGAWFDAIVDLGSGPRIVDLRQNVPLRRMEAHGHHEDAGHDEHDHAGHAHHEESPDMPGTDPHIWLSPSALLIQIRTMADALKQADPHNAAAYEQRYQQLRDEINQTQQEIRSTLEPVAGSSFYVFHPAWGYFADAFSLRQTPIEVEGKQPDDRQLIDLQAQAKRDRATVIFVQPQVTGKAAQAVAKSIGGRVETIDPLAYDVLANLRAVAQKMREALAVQADLKAEADAHEDHDHAHEGHTH